MMRKLLIIFSFFTSIILFGQSSANPFAGENTDSKSENIYASPNAATAVPDNAMQPTGNGNGNNGNGLGNGGNPGPIPIDDYIPVLLLVALGFIVYQKRLFRASQS